MILILQRMLHMLQLLLEKTHHELPHFHWGFYNQFWFLSPVISHWVYITSLPHSSLVWFVITTYQTFSGFVITSYLTFIAEKVTSLSFGFLLPVTPL